MAGWSPWGGARSPPASENPELPVIPLSFIFAAPVSERGGGEEGTKLCGSKTANSVMLSVKVTEQKFGEKYFPRWMEKEGPNFKQKPEIKKMATSIPTDPCWEAKQNPHGNASSK